MFSSLISATVTIAPNELEERVKDLLHDKLSINAFNDASQADNASKVSPKNQASTNKSDIYVSAIAKLCVENMILKNKLDNALQTAKASTDQLPYSMIVEPLVEADSPKPDTFENFHLVRCARGRHGYYRDAPRMFQGDLISDHLRGQHGLPKDLHNFLKDHPNIIFTIIKSYICACNGGRSYHGTVGYKDGKLVADSPPAIAAPKNVQICLGTRIHGIIKSIIKSHAESFKGYSAVDFTDWWTEPYYFFFNHNKTLLSIATSSDVSESDRSCIHMLCNWFETNHSEDWDEARELMSRGKINPKHFAKLFVPDELYVGTTRYDPDVLEVFKSKEFPWLDSHQFMSHYNWGFNGRFSKKTWKSRLRQFPKPFVSEKTEVDITSLPIYPLRFAEPGTKEKLIARGHKFWNCRTRTLVCYRESGEAPLLAQVRDPP